MTTPSCTRIVLDEAEAAHAHLDLAAQIVKLVLGRVEFGERGCHLPRRRDAVRLPALKEGERKGVLLDQRVQLRL